MSFEEPGVFKSAFNCPSCNAYANQTWHEARAFESRSLEDLFNRTGEGRQEYLRKERDRILSKESKTPTVFFGNTNNIYTTIVLDTFFGCCAHCGGISIWHDDKMVHPKVALVIAPHADMPLDVKAEYIEGASILDTSPRAAMALLRLALQKLCGYIGGKGKKIDDDIAALVKDGLDVRVQRALDSIRVIGNNAVHPGKIDGSDDITMAKSMFRLLNFVVEKTISEKKEIDEIYELLPPGALEAIERRDQQ